jgi:hypothetical protein
MNLNSIVNAVNDPSEKAIIKGFAQRITSSCGLGRAQISHDKVVLRVLVNSGTQSNLQSNF